MGVCIDLTGQVIGNYRVIERSGSYKKKAVWKVECLLCGRIREYNTNRLKRTDTKGCGCGLGDNHGLSNHPLYSIWHDMKRRCTDDRRASYKNYGGRGIKVCKAWTDHFAAFYEWAIENGYRKGLTIERIDNNDGYNPSNCTWADRQTQNRNTRHCCYVTIEGDRMTLSEAADRFNIPYNTIHSRYYTYGWPDEYLILKPSDGRQRARLPAHVRKINRKE